MFQYRPKIYNADIILNLFINIILNLKNMIFKSKTEKISLDIALLTSLDNDVIGKICSYSPTNEFWNT